MARPVDNAADKSGGDTPDWVARSERSNVPTMRLIVWIALHLGRPVARALLAPIAAYFLLFSARATRAASRKYLAKVLGHAPGLTDLYRHYHTFSSVILDRVFFLSGRFGALDVRLHNAEAITAALAAGRGCVLLGAHLGSFEAIRALGQQRLAPPANLVMYEENARKLNSVLYAIDPELAQRVIALGKTDSMLKVRDALQRGEFVGMLADRVIEGEGSAVCQFLDEAARFPTGPLRMAAIMKAPVLLMTGLYRGGSRYDVYFEQLLRPGELEASARETEIARAVQAYAARIEHYCRMAPYNWFNFYDFWN
jgi:predicted LPLAT superfamily acyltransferase